MLKILLPDKMPSPKVKIRFFNKKIHSFHFFGVLGYILGSLLGIYLCYLLKLQINIILSMSLMGAATFFALAFLAKIIAGKETIVYYHHEIAILIICAIVLTLFHMPVLNYLDITILGIATFLAFGRIGCFLVGCCYGKPARKGVEYGHTHVEDGFPFYLENVPLFPIQLVESAFVFMVIISGSLMLFQHLPAGSVLIFYTAVYGAFRYIIEFFRGDADRPYYRGLSEAQWTTIFLMSVSLAFSLMGFIPFYYWHLITTICLIAISLFVIIKNKEKKSIFDPHHVMQIASGLILLNDYLNKNVPQNIIKTYQTNLGLVFSKGQFETTESLITHYTVSSKTKIRLNLKIVQKLASLVKKLQKHTGSYQVAEKQNGIFHILFSENPS
ncbi:MAG: prolipoprotein diacylglyceryl transferase [Bacteroidetes bacterium]|nr:prolipoprotein diacylglyceryl transferase [Bacteroidota bacterium]